MRQTVAQEGTLLAELKTSGSGTVRRQLLRRDTDQAVEKIRLDHFLDFTETQLHSVLVSGLNLMETLTQDKRSNRRGLGPTMGCTYYSTLRSPWLAA